LSSNDRQAETYRDESCRTTNEQHPCLCYGRGRPDAAHLLRDQQGASTVFPVEAIVFTPVADYLIDQSGIDWPRALATWTWLLPQEFTVWLVSRFADLFIALPDGSIHMLDVGAGTLAKIADSRDDFCIKIHQEDNVKEWLMIPLVDRMVAAGIDLRPGECYGFKIPPVIDGEYTVENCGPLRVWDDLGAYGSVHEQLRDVPDGSRVVLKVVSPPA
jgi:hypothetical protein